MLYLELLLFVFSRLNQRFHQHLCGGLVTSPVRGSELDTGSCALLPGEYGQWACVARGLDPSSPYLLLWATIMSLEGTSCVDQREVLKACGWVVPFRWRVGTGNKVENPVSTPWLAPMFCYIFVLCRSSHIQAVPGACSAASHCQTMAWAPVVGGLIWLMLGTSVPGWALGLPGASSPGCWRGPGWWTRPCWSAPCPAWGPFKPWICVYRLPIFL
jgi:hypothetical protein